MENLSQPNFLSLGLVWVENILGHVFLQLMPDQFQDSPKVVFRDGVPRSSHEVEHPEILRHAKEVAIQKILHLEMLIAKGL